MHFSTITILLGLAASSLAAPVAMPAADLDERAAGAGASVLKVQTYNQFSVSAGVAGNALAEVNAKFPVNSANLASVSASDLAIIKAAAKLGEQAEIAKGGFNDAIAAAGGTKTTAGIALQNGKIKNKVLKLQTDILRIQIEAAQGNAGSAGDLAGQQKKLANNVALDKKAAGQASTAISFAGSD